MNEAHTQNSPWSHPLTLDNLSVAFGANVERLMPKWEDIPPEFQRFQGTYWNRWQAEWFYKGLKSIPIAKPGIDRDTAIHHLRAIQGSWEPKHEHKEAAVAYLASLWFEEPKQPEEKPRR